MFPVQITMPLGEPLLARDLLFEFRLRAFCSERGFGGHTCEGRTDPLAFLAQGRDVQRPAKRPQGRLEGLLKVFFRVQIAWMKVEEESNRMRKLVFVRFNPRRNFVALLGAERLDPIRTQEPISDPGHKPLSSHDGGRLSIRLGRRPPGLDPCVNREARTFEQHRQFARRDRSRAGLLGELEQRPEATAFEATIDQIQTIDVPHHGPQLRAVLFHEDVQSPSYGCAPNRNASARSPWKPLRKSTRCSAKKTRRIVTGNMLIPPDLNR